MELMTAFSAMLSDVTHANASDSQILGILTWLDRAREAVRRAAALEAEAGLEVSFAEAATHRAWRMTSHVLVAAFAAQEDEARARRGRADQDAAREDRDNRIAAAEAAQARDTALSARARAAAARSRACVARARAAAADEQGAAFFLAEADAADAEAAIADSEALLADERARQQDMIAGEHRRRAAAARKLAGELTGWEQAARDARDTGEQVLKDHDPRLTRVSESQARAGGAREVPRDKRYMTSDSARPPAMAATGGGDYL
jgi:hypothetical protein